MKGIATPGLLYELGATFGQVDEVPASVMPPTVPFHSEEPFEFMAGVQPGHSGSGSKTVIGDRLATIALGEPE